MSLPKAKVQRTLFDVPVLVGGLFAATDKLEGWSPLQRDIY